MVPALHSTPGDSSSMRWSIFAGLFLFLAGTVTALLLDDMLVPLTDLSGVPGAYSVAILASPAFLVGAVAWWAVVERRNAYTYFVGATAGLLTALLTGILLTARFAAVWGLELLTVSVVPVLVGIVLGLAAIAGVLAGLPLMYARRRLGSGLEAETPPE